MTPPDDEAHHDVYVIRHGATEWSRSGRHTGTTDLALLDEGVDEARATGLRLGHRPFALVLVSPLRRARVTCELAGYADQAEVTDDLREWDYGDLEGMTTADIGITYPGWTVWRGPIPDGEALDEVAARADRVIERARAAGGEVALFGHGHMLRVLAARWCELPPGAGQRLPLDTGTISRLGWEHDYPALREWNGR